MPDENQFPLVALDDSDSGRACLRGAAVLAQQPFGGVKLAEPVAEKPAGEKSAADAPAPLKPGGEPGVLPADPKAVRGNPAEAAEATPASPAPPTTAIEPSHSEDTDVVVELIKERFPGGAMKVEREMAQDSTGSYQLHGAWRHYDEQGRLILDGRYIHNAKDGLWRRFFHGDEVHLLATAPYKDFTAPFISSATFHAGVIHGKWTISDSKQRKVHELEYCDGERHGKATWYYPNGAIMLQARYEHSRVNGDVIQFAPDSSIIAKESYQSGRKLAPKIEYYDQAQQVKKQEVTYLHAMLVVKTPDNWDTATLASFENRERTNGTGPSRPGTPTAKSPSKANSATTSPSAKSATGMPTGRSRRKERTSTAGRRASGPGGTRTAKRPSRVNTAMLSRLANGHGGTPAARWRSEPICRMTPRGQRH